MKKKQELFYYPAENGFYLPESVTSITFSGVSFYNQEKMITDVSLRLTPGNIYGITGNETAIKSLVDLLCGFNKPVEGTISINEHLDLNAVQDWFSHVTLMRNFPKAFDDEKEVIFNAEDCLAMSPVIIIDDVLSSMNIEEEEKFLHEMTMKNKNNIIILNTQRASSLKYCDEIFLMKSTKMVEMSKPVYFINFLDTLADSV